jgi:hypothetical protein
LQDNSSRSFSPRKREVILPLDNFSQIDSLNRHKLRGHLQKQKGKSRFRFEEQLQPALPPAALLPL